MSYVHIAPYNCITIFRLNIEGWCTLYTGIPYTSVQFYRLIVHCSFCTLLFSWIVSFWVLTNETIPLKLLIPGYCYSRGNFRFSALLLFYIDEYICIVLCCCCFFFFWKKTFRSTQSHYKHEWPNSLEYSNIYILYMVSFLFVPFRSSNRLQLLQRFIVVCANTVWIYNRSAKFGYCYHSLIVVHSIRVCQVAIMIIAIK